MAVPVIVAFFSRLLSTCMLFVYSFERVPLKMYLGINTRLINNETHKIRHYLCHSWKKMHMVEINFPDLKFRCQVRFSIDVCRMGDWDFNLKVGAFEMLETYK